MGSGVSSWSEAGSKSFAPPGMRVLVVDDDPAVLETVTVQLRQRGASVLGASSSATALACLEGEPAPDIALVDVVLDRSDGVELARSIRAHRKIPVVLMSSFASRETVTRAIAAGAAHVLPKPVDSEAIGRALESCLLGNGSTGDAHSRPCGRIVSRDPRMLEATTLAEQFARCEVPVLITGETGTGKELMARLIHDESPRRRGPFVDVNCAAIPQELFESEFFGYVKGSFTGALDGGQQGWLEAAAGGTLFLDEIGAMPPELQAKLLRVLQDRSFRRVGSRNPVWADFRLVAATNADLESASREGRFRQDLYYRLNVLRVCIPPLRERPGDMRELASFLLGRFAAESGCPAARLSSSAMNELMAHSWPGNVRELDSVLRRAALSAPGGVIERVGLGVERHGPSIGRFSNLAARAREAFERAYLEQLLRQTRGNLRLAAKASGLSRRQLQRMRARYELDLGEYAGEV